ncbi:glutamyl-tRNA reductase [Nitratifractor sp.]|uniref:glutamyl-tRNA reductase n=1 Tax=Nitratifractor sp. TaxID=2268144 RepID=UPI0025D947FA|nr:glutamyl-tRNA reductase [Nitratifractor sp.]
MHYQVVSFNYRHCDLQQRERLAFRDEEEIREFLRTLEAFDFLLEAFVINTCNRIEIVTASRDNFATFHAVLGLLSRTRGINFYELEKSAKRYEDKEAVTHLFSVVSSLDSLVIGEAQITGQVKQGFKLSYENGTAGRELNRVVSYAVKCAAEVRNATNISENPVSIASVAVAQAQELMNGSLAGMTGIVVGTGEMGRLAAKHLLRAGADVLLVSRTRERAEALAEELGENVRVGSLERLPIYLNRYRLLFTATASPEPIITPEMIEEKALDRLWFDMAIPRDIAEMPECDVRIFRIDDLQAISKNNHALRQEQALRAGEIVDRYVEEFYRWLQALSVEPVIKQMRLEIAEVVEEEVQRALRKGYISEVAADNVRYLVAQAFDKYLHRPTKNLRLASKESDGSRAIDAIKMIFEIDTSDVDPRTYKNQTKDTQS